MDIANAAPCHSLLKDTDIVVLNCKTCNQCLKLDNIAVSVFVEFRLDLDSCRWNTKFMFGPVTQAVLNKK